MDIPSLPTDNLYKFCAILGLTLFVFNTYYSTEMSYRSKENEINIKGERELAKTLEKSFESELKILDAEIEKVELQADYSTNRLQMHEAARKGMTIGSVELLEFEALIINLNNQTKDSQNEVKKLYQQQLDLLRKKIIEKQNLITKNELQVIAESKNLKYKMYLIIGDILGICIALWGFRGWYKMDKKN